MALCIFGSLFHFGPCFCKTDDKRRQKPSEAMFVTRPLPLHVLTHYMSVYWNEGNCIIIWFQRLFSQRPQNNPGWFNHLVQLTGGRTWHNNRTHPVPLFSRFLDCMSTWATSSSEAAPPVSSGLHKVYVNLNRKKWQENWLSKSRSLFHPSIHPSIGQIILSFGSMSPVNLSWTNKTDSTW